MKISTARKLANIMAEAAEEPTEDDNVEAFAIASFGKFEKDILALLKEGDVEPEIMSFIGLSLDAQHKSARNATIRIGMLNLMIEIATYCYQGIKDKDLVERTKEQIKKWREQKEEAEENLKKLETLSPDDILNAPPLEKE